MNRLTLLILQILVWSLILLVIYFTLIKTGIIWILVILGLFIFYINRTGTPVKNPETPDKSQDVPIKCNDYCYKCKKIFDHDSERHFLTGYCFSCISSHEDLLMEAFDAERKHSQKSPKGAPRLYDIYISSDKWKRIAARKKIEVGNKCFNCESSNNLNVHHHSYENLGNESMWDLTVLCRECHHLLHGSRKLYRSRVKVKEDVFDVNKYMEGYYDEKDLN